MKDISIASVINKNSFASDVAWLIALEVDVKDPETGLHVETLYLVNNNEGLEINGNSYVAVPFEIDLKAEQGEIPEVNLVIQDQTRAIQSYMQRYNGGVGFNVKMHIVNSGLLDEPPEITEFFEVMNASSSSYVATWKLGAENLLRQKCPRRTQRRDFCSWQYRDPDTCGYAGEMPSCDLSLDGENGCQAHDNENRYGGFPAIQVRNL